MGERLHFEVRMARHPVKNFALPLISHLAFAHEIDIMKND